jgi:hypothetical protein
MNHGSLPHRIARALPSTSIEPDYAPDGLTEADIDALAAEAGIELDAEPADEEQVFGPVIRLRPSAEPPATGWGNEAA